MKFEPDLIPFRTRPVCIAVAFDDGCGSAVGNGGVMRG